MRYSRGFTLVELMITLAVAAIILGFAAPNFQNMILHNTANRDRDTLYNALVYARTEAIKRGKRVAICKSTNTTSCDSTAAWTSGWLIFEDLDGDSTLDAGEMILRVQSALSSGMSLAYSGGANVIWFDGVGRSSGAGDFQFTHSSGNADYSRTVKLSSTGRVRKE